MLDIRAVSEQYGLTSEQASSLEASYRSLPKDLQDGFGIRDFETLMASKGIRGFPPGDGDLPSLPQARSAPSLSSNFAAIASPGAAIMALLTQNAAEQRQINKEVKAAEAESVAKMIESQAKDMREKAVIQLVMGVASGAITIAGGALTAGKASASLNAGNVSQNTALQTNVKLTGESQAYQGAASIASTLSTFAGTMYDAKIKETDAKIERARANVENLKDVNEALTDLIRKSISTAEAIQESANQARGKILA